MECKRHYVCGWRCCHVRYNEKKLHQNIIQCKIIIKCFKSVNCIWYHEKNASKSMCYVGHCREELRICSLDPTHCFEGFHTQPEVHITMAGAGASVLCICGRTYTLYPCAPSFPLLTILLLQLRARRLICKFDV